MPEVIRHGQTGYLCQVGDIDGMTRAALSILTDKEAWQAMSDFGIEDARARFSLDQIVSQYEHLYTTSLAP